MGLRASSKHTAAWRITLVVVAVWLMYCALGPCASAGQQTTPRRQNAEVGLLMPTRGSAADDDYELRSDGRRSQVSCRGDAEVCRDPERNPDGGFTCCWNRVCKDTEMDINHCGGCGRRCSFGLHCCGGTCVNLLWDNFHCGCCGHRCWAPSQCAFGMCGYAGSSLQ